MLATPVIEALQEGPGESLASNQILGSVLGFDTPLNRAEILENMTAGGLGGGGASVRLRLLQAAPRRRLRFLTQSLTVSDRFRPACSINCADIV